MHSLDIPTESRGDVHKCINSKQKDKGFLFVSEEFPPEDKVLPCVDIKGMFESNAEVFQAVFTCW